MLISIITPSYNQGEYIEECILSVMNQGFKNFEHIIVDGESTDNTLSILKKYPHLKWISEKDEGQSDALNKALRFVNGDIVGWLNSDDVYCDGTFKKVENAFLDFPESYWIVGNQMKKFELMEKIYEIPFHHISFKSISYNCDIIRTQSAFYKNSIFKNIGGFDINFHQVMDYDLWIRFSKIGDPINVKENFSVFRVHKNQKTSIKNSFKQLKELTIIFLRERNYAGLTIKYTSFCRQMLSVLLKIVLIKLHIIDPKYRVLPFLSQFKEHGI